jgi:hypothetical protein
MTRPKRALPTPMELAKLAALLPRSSTPADQVLTALELWIETTILYQECASLSFEQLVAKYRNKQQAAIERSQAWWGDVLELNPEKHSDQVRDYLAKRGVHFKTADKVLEHVRAVWSAIPMLTPQHWSFNAMINRNSTAPYLIPRFLLDAVVAASRRKRRKSKRTSQAKSRAKSRPRKVVK